MSRYAEGTSVSVERTKTEIERTLTRYGATAFAYGWQTGRASIQFEAKGRRIRFLLPLPDQEEKRFTQKLMNQFGTMGPRDPGQARKLWEQSCCQAWRALLLIVKAKLEAVEAQIVAFEDEFLAQIVLPDGQTVGDHLKPQVALAYQSGTMPKMLPDFSGRAN